MKNKIAIYLAGSIKKGHEKGESYWTEENIQDLQNCLSDYDVSLLNPAFRTDDLSDQLSVFGRDMLQVFCSDIVFVDARDRRGLGVGAEMMWAKLHKTPIVTWAPKNTHYHKSQTTILGVPVNDFVHPFVEALSDKIVETISEAADWIKALKAGEALKIKGIEHIEHAMNYYRNKQLMHDKPMQELMQAHEELEKSFRYGF